MSSLPVSMTTNAPARRRADATPLASALIESMRDIGYSLETALADIIDNAITAKATRVDVLSETSGEHPALAILDNGEGMTEAQLIEAMRPGSRNPLDNREEHDLGRFGLGLKSASFSQCRRLTVLTRRDEQTSCAVWDLDEVARTNEWAITLLEDHADIPWHNRLGKSGTLVVWQQLDRLSGGISHDIARRADHINRAISLAERHLRLVFHRFMEEGGKALSVWLNGRKLQPIDPFARGHPAHQRDPEDRLQLAGGVITFQCFTLPHHKAMTKQDWDDLGGPEGHLRSQGFYIYRGRRLIIAGSWLGLARQTELTKLCRIRVDIPNTMDASWKIDVKKASAQLPPAVRERMRHIVERFSQTSKRTYQRRGQRLVDEHRMPVWQRVQRDGIIVYRPDLDHPALASFADSLPHELRQGFTNCISLIAGALPVEALHADFAGSAEEIRADEVDGDTIRQTLEAMLPSLAAQGCDREQIEIILRQLEPFRSAWTVTEGLIEELTKDDADDE
ncbi:ATP-binding protein [Sphingomonas koreensis]|nr:ATP-binding protein [Sphingomonas koreensis]